GEGKMVIDKAGSGSYTGFEFTGDVSAWKGAFEMNATNTFNLVFSGAADEIVNDIKNTSTEGRLILKLQSGNDMSLSGNITTDSIEISNTRKVKFSGNVDTDSLKVSNDAELVFGGDSSSSTISSLTSEDDIQLTKNGSGTLLISGGASAISSLEVNGGILEMAGYGDGSKSINSNITVNSGAELRFSDKVEDILNYDATDKSITVNGGTVDFGATRQTMGAWELVLSNGSLVSGSGDSYTENGKTGQAALDFNNNDSTICATSGESTISAVTRLRGGINLNYDVSKDATLTASGLIHADGVSGKGSITKKGQGTLVLSAANTYAGTTTVSEGTLSIVHKDALGGSAVEVRKDATLEFSTGENYSLGATMDVYGALVANGDGRMDIGASGTMTLHDGATVSRTNEKSGWIQGVLAVAAGAENVVYSSLDDIHLSYNNGSNEGKIQLAAGGKMTLDVKGLYYYNGASATLDEGAELTLAKSNVVIANRGEGTATLKALQTTATQQQGQKAYSIDNDNFELANGHLNNTAGSEKTLKNLLTNSSVENGGSGVLKVWNAANSL
ncbi:MAG: autotransporter-associated beta strand repeat-containing protein, partial [Akkermansia sp.]|nr:autotransporter-associated beta strand repeat-containing protein [Akkermansia sp.]